MSGIQATNNNSESEKPENQISMQLYQDVYHEITGKKEKLGKRFTEDYQLSIDDFQQLDNKVDQLFETYTVCAKNVNIELLLSDNSKSTFSSIGRFKSHSSSSNIATRSVIFEYNYLIEHSVSKKKSNYKLVVQVISGVSVFEDIQESVPKIFWSEMGFMIGKVEIEYVDFMIAQNIVNGVNGWFDSLNKYTQAKWADTLQKKSALIPDIFKYIFCVIATLGLVGVSSAYIASFDTDFLLFYQFAAWSGLIFALSSTMGYRIGRYIEKSIDTVWKISYIKLSKGDSRVIEKAKEHNKRNWISVIANSISPIIVGVLTSIVVNLLQNG